MTRREASSTRRLLIYVYIYYIYSFAVARCRHSGSGGLVKTAGILEAMRACALINCQKPREPTVNVRPYLPPPPPPPPPPPSSPLSLPFACAGALFSGSYVFSFSSFCLLLVLRARSSRSPFWSGSLSLSCLFLIIILLLPYCARFRSSFLLLPIGHGRRTYFCGIISWSHLPAHIIISALDFNLQCRVHWSDNVIFFFFYYCYYSDALLLFVSVHELLIGAE